MAREMKDSGIKWVGDIAFDFYMLKLKYASIILDQFRKPVTADQRNQEGEMLYDYYGASGAIDKINDYTIDDHVMLIGEDGANLKMRNLPLMYEVNGKAWINNHAHILKPKQGMDFYYLFYVLEAIDINPYITGSAQPKLSQENLKNIWIPVPDVNIQKEIVRCIKGACMELDNVIEKTRASIEEYKKLKQAVITKAVTKGIIGNREMKDSSVEWIGSIPIGWKLIPFRHVLKERQVKNSPIKSEERLSLSIDLGVTLYAEKTTNLDRFKDDFEQYKLAYEGDLVMNSMNMIVGATGVSDYFGCVSPVYYTFYDELEDHVTAKYCEYIFRSKTMLRVLYSLGKGIYAIVRGDDRVNTCRLKVSKEDLKSIIIPIPPVEEQREIVNYLKKKCLAIDELIAKKEQYLSEVENYKKSLIYEYVTGKKEVPEE